MVATAGPGWRLAPSLVVLMRELDALYPDRDRRSDGSIGNAEHSARSSDHNPYRGWVHAIDADEDLAAGLDLAQLVAQLVAAQDPRIRYLIYEGRICEAYASNGHPAWTWQPYTGPNAHKTHLHVSINRTVAARENTGPWFTTQELTMADIDRLLARLDALAGAVHNIELRIIELDADVPENVADQLGEIRRNLRRVAAAAGVDPAAIEA